MCLFKNSKDTTVKTKKKKKKDEPITISQKYQLVSVYCKAKSAPQIPSVTMHPNKTSFMAGAWFLKTVQSPDVSLSDQALHLGSLCPRLSFGFYFRQV